MTGWLPKEILDHLEHAGYVAIPKDRITVVNSSEMALDWRLYSNRVDKEGLREAIQSELARRISEELMRGGFIAVEQSPGDEDQIIRHSASVTALKPPDGQTNGTPKGIPDVYEAAAKEEQDGCFTVYGPGEHEPRFLWDAYKYFERLQRRDGIVLQLFRYYPVRFSDGRAGYIAAARPLGEIAKD